MGKERPCKPKKEKPKKKDEGDPKSRGEIAALANSLRDWGNELLKAIYEEE